MRAGGRPHRWPSPNTCCVNPQWEGERSAYLAGPNGGKKNPHPCYPTAGGSSACSRSLPGSPPPSCAWASGPRCPDCVPFSPTGNTPLPLASGKRIFRSPVRVSDAPLICPRLFLPGEAAAALFLPHTLPPPPMPTLALAPGWARLMTRRRLDAISAQSGRNPPPPPLHPSPQPHPDLRLRDSTTHLLSI